MFGLGAGEIFVILIFALVFLGPKKLPELAKGLGKGIREFQKAKDGLFDEIHSTPASEEKPKVSHSDAAQVSDVTHVAEENLNKDNIDPAKNETVYHAKVKTEHYVEENRNA